MKHQDHVVRVSPVGSKWHAAHHWGRSITIPLVVLCAQFGAVHPAAGQADESASALDAAIERYSERQRRQLMQGARDASADADTLGLRPFWRPRATKMDEAIFACSFPSLTLQEEPATQPAEQPADQRATDAGGGESLEDINNKLNNPGASLASLNFKFTWNQFKGDLGGGTGWRLTGTGLRRRSVGPARRLRNLFTLKQWSKGEGASSQNSLAMNFQPVFPFKLDDHGSNFMVRPSIPVVWQPSYNAGNGGFDENFGLGDSQLVMFYANTNKETGVFWGAGPTMQFPTHTDDTLGNDAFMIGPAAYAGIMGKWGVLGVFPQHWWNIGGGDGYTSFTATQLFYWFSVGKGYQIGGAPTITYDWAADDSDQAWTIPINLGVAKTILLGKTPVKLKFEGIYYVEQPDAFGPHWGLQLTITPVIPNPFDGSVARK